MNLREILPCAGLCARIPKGFFRDSIFVWYPVEAEDGVCNVAFLPVLRDDFPRDCVPAPTLQEIIWEDLNLPLQGNANTALHQWLM